MIARFHKSQRYGIRQERNRWETNNNGSVTVDTNGWQWDPIFHVR